MKKSPNILNMIVSIYNNEFQWSLVKSVTVFALGVKIAKELINMEIMPAVAPV